jgi:hypothetical protein
MKDNSCVVVMSVTLAIPNSGQAPPVRLTKVMVLLFMHWFVQSIWIQIE